METEVEKFNKPFMQWWRHQGFSLFEGRLKMVDMEGAYGAGGLAAQESIAALEAENERLREVLDEIAWPLKDRPECAGFTVLLKTTADLQEMARAALDTPPT